MIYLALRADSGKSLLAFCDFLLDWPQLDYTGGRDLVTSNSQEYEYLKLYLESL